MSKYRILVVEDEAIVAMGIKEKLEDLGHEVVDIVFNGEEAVEKAIKIEPDLILMDIILKGDMDGIEAASEIRNRLDIPIIYLTAYSDEEILKRARMTEPYGYILKPFNNSELNANIEMALYKHKEDEKKIEEVKKKILSDFYDFILNSMPTNRDQTDAELKNTILKLFSARLEEEMRPRFEKELGDMVEEENLNDLESIFKTYLLWLSQLFADFGIQSKIIDKKHMQLFEVLNCPWINEAKKKPVFCLNCHAILGQSFEWTGMEGDVELKTTIADGNNSCIFKFHVPFMEK
ncbi:MAG: methanogen output domain 1-containing protein [Methanobacteriaceae archaeon]